VPLNPYQQYHATKVETAGSVDLVVMLYQGAVRFTRLGMDALGRNDPQAAHANFVRAQDIIVELLGSLNREAGGQIAGQLASIYDYCFRQLVAANIKKEPAAAREVVGILRELGTAWQEIAAQQRAAQTTAAQTSRTQAAVAQSAAVQASFPGRPLTTPAR
jgi:flagellar secretion chaperone FliS